MSINKGVLLSLLILNLVTYMTCNIVLTAMNVLCSPTAKYHTSPGCFAAYNGTLKCTESCHTLVHNLVRVFLHEIPVTLGVFGFSIAYRSFQYEECIMFPLKKLHDLSKLCYQMLTSTAEQVGIMGT